VRSSVPVASPGVADSMSLEPVKLSPELKRRLRALANDWSVQVEAFSSSTVHSEYFPERTRGGLKCDPPSSRYSPWNESYTPPVDDPPDVEARAAKLAAEVGVCSRLYMNRLVQRAALPIARVRQQFLSAVHEKRVTLVSAETGSGKSTQVPQFILDEFGAECHVVCTQPRRLAAISLAQRVSWERGGYSDYHASTGYMVRWDERPPRPWGSIVFCTVGALLSRLNRLGASHIVVDEAHVKDVHTDLLLTVLVHLVNSSPTLRVVVMSATFDVARLHFFFGGSEFCAVVEANGRAHPVRELYLEDIVTELGLGAPPPGLQGSLLLLIILINLWLLLLFMLILVLLLLCLDCLLCLLGCRVF
jgi:hypothetical protein